MSTTNAILSTITAGLFLWFLQQVVSYFIRKSRLERALAVDINCHLSVVKELDVFLNKLFSEKITQGQQIQYCPHLTKDEFYFYKSIQKELIEYFNKNQIEKITKIYRHLREWEILVEGVMLDMSAWQNQKRELSEEDIHYLKSKKDRIDSFAHVLSRDKIMKIEDLPSDYSGIKGPGHIMR